MTEDFVSVIARTVAPRVRLMTPSAAYNEIDIAIRKGIAEYRRRSNQPDRLHQEWIRGLATGIGMTLITVTITAGICGVILK